MVPADFSGYATKHNLKCSDGRTILPGAFKHNDKLKVPLVWQHKYDVPGNILGHALLEYREDGMYTYCFFNDSPTAANAKQLVKHGDINSLSIYANELTQKGTNVLHGTIREVSLVLSGANPGATIDTVNIRHSDGDDVEEEAIIYTGLALEHANEGDNKMATATDNKEDLTVKDIFDSMTDEQKNVVYYLVGEAIEGADEEGDDVEHSAVEPIDADALSKEITDNIIKHFQEDPTMSRNVFDQTTQTAHDKPTLTHAQLEAIVADGQKYGSLKESFLAHAATYGIENIDYLFPDAKTVTPTPEVVGRRTEWVAGVLAKTKHSPFSRIKSTAVDLTADEARAKGYVKANKKKDEIVKLLKRVTTPTTVYKKQKLDRDDVVDITELDVIAWLKAEMRLMLDEEIARAILVGDGREPDDEDKINEDHLRPIAYDDEMYAHRVNLAANSTPSQTIEAIVRARSAYKGTGTPTMYTTDEVLTDLILDKDTLGRRYYNTEAELAAALRVDSVVACEAMEDAADVVAVIVNLFDYTIGADKGGEISFFDDFDIDYNQQKYLIETRISGALTRPKSAIVIRKAPGTVVTPTQPLYNSSTHVLTIPSVTGVIYSIDGVDKTAGNITITETTEVEARPAANYSFPHNIDADWVHVF